MMQGDFRYTTFGFQLQCCKSEERLLARHAGARRFARNQSLRFVLDALKQKETNSEVRVPWSGFDLINTFNKWKVSPEAGQGEEGDVGLSWRSSVCSQVFEEGAVDLGAALKNFRDSKTGKRSGRKVGFPVFESKHRSRPSFRLRNKRNGIRLGKEGSERTIVLPKIGALRLRGSTRCLRRLLRKRDAKICSVTVIQRAGRWFVRILVKAPRLRHIPAPRKSPVGIDRGLKTFVVIATDDGSYCHSIHAPKPLATGLRKLQRASRRLSRRRKGSQNRKKAVRHLQRVHARHRNIRQDFIHRTSTQLVKTHDQMVLEDLNVAGMLRNRKLARHIADAGWSEFASKVAYKAQWHGRRIARADRFYPSSKRCSRCTQVRDSLKLSERTFRCEACGFEADRDLNASMCLAQWPRVAGKQSETRKKTSVEESFPLVASATGSDEAETARGQACLAA